MTKITKELVLVKGINHRNSHVLKAIGDAYIVYEESDILSEDRISFIVKNGKVKLVHPEHGTLFLDEGIYTMYRQVEYNPFTRKNEFVYD